MEVDAENTILSYKLWQDSMPLQQAKPIFLKPKPQQPILITCRTAVPHNSGLFLRRARTYANDEQYHYPRHPSNRHFVAVD
jgi:hypothetical protein